MTRVLSVMMVSYLQSKVYAYFENSMLDIDTYIREILTANSNPCHVSGVLENSMDLAKAINMPFDFPGIQ